MYVCLDCIQEGRDHARALKFARMVVSLATGTGASADCLSVYYWAQCSHGQQAGNIVPAMCLKMLD